MHESWHQHHPDERDIQKDTQSWLRKRSSPVVAYESWVGLGEIGNHLVDVRFCVGSRGQVFEYQLIRKAVYRNRAGYRHGHKTDRRSLEVVEEDVLYLLSLSGPKGATTGLEDVVYACRSRYHKSRYDQPECDYQESEANDDARQRSQTPTSTLWDPVVERPGYARACEMWGGVKRVCKGNNDRRESAATLPATVGSETSGKHEIFPRCDEF